MPSYSLNVQTVLNTEECCNCHMLFAMPADFQRRRREEGGQFFCPQGHSQYYSDTEVMKLRADLAAKERRLEIAINDAQRETQLRQKLEKRIRNGVCPHCKRSFTNIKRHIETKHKQCGGV